MRTFVPTAGRTAPESKPAVSSDSRRSLGDTGMERRPQARAEDVACQPHTGTSPTFAHDFSRILVHAATHSAIQPKLRVNTPGDAYEQEADRIAAKVMRMPEPRLRRMYACGGGSSRYREEEGNHEHSQAERVPSDPSGEIAAPPLVHDVLRSSGQPLDSTTRAFMEPRFGHDFSRVRVHTDAQAADSAREVHARAYTSGRDVAFGTGQFAPGTTEGRRLLAHELTHVLQQRQGASGHVVARASSERDVPESAGETPGIEASTTAAPSAESGLGVRATLKEFYNKGNPPSGLAQQCDVSPYFVGVGLEGRAQHGVATRWGLETTKKPAKTPHAAKSSASPSVQAEPWGAFTFDSDQRYDVTAWERVPMNGAEKWRTLGTFTDVDDNWSPTKCMIPNEAHEVFDWDNPGFNTANVTGKELVADTISEKATGVSVQINFRTRVSATKNGNTKQFISPTCEWHSVHCTAPDQNNQWKMVDTPFVNEVEPGHISFKEPQ